jgi:hypothetical protein
MAVKKLNIGLLSAVQQQIAMGKEQNERSRSTVIHCSTADSTVKGKNQRLSTVKRQTTVNRCSTADNKGANSHQAMFTCCNN